MIKPPRVQLDRSAACATARHGQCPQQPGAPAPRCRCECHATAGYHEPIALPSGPLIEGEIYRAAVNRYFRNPEFARRVDETVNMIKSLGLTDPYPSEMSTRVLLTGVIIGMYQAGA